MSMTKRKQYLAVGIITGLITGAFVFILSSQDITGILFILFLISIVFFGYISIITLLSSFTRNVSKTSNKVAKFLDLFLP